MQSFFNSTMGILVLASFLVLLVLILIMQSLAKALQKSINMAKYIQERGPIEQEPELPKKEDLLPGYTTLTHEDYDAIVVALKKEFSEELRLAALKKGS